MATVPTGSPAWTRTATAETYGGHAGKRNLGGVGAVNAKTDVTAEEWLRMSSDLARVVHSAPVCLISLEYTYSGGVLTVTSATVTPQWGDTETYPGDTTPGPSYPSFETNVAAPSDLIISFPGITSFSGEWYLTPYDDYGVPGRFQLTSADVQENGGTNRQWTLSDNGTVLTILGCTDGGVLTVILY